MMRRVPTDRAKLWEPWRRRIAGERVHVTDEPMCGRYRAKRGGQWVAVQIDIVQPIENGELVGDEHFAVWVQGERFDDLDRIYAVWLRCAGNPIDDAEFKRILGIGSIFSDLSRNVVT